MGGDRVRPRCPRCGEPYDLQPDLDEDGCVVRLSCVSLRSGRRFAKPTWSQDDAEFWLAWDQLSGDEVAAIERQIHNQGDAK